ncbi:uncharacterized protein LOC122368684 [Amphibalanus amphitrite]|uniref:uncharacterized protein LOC122367847 n=1 Tax=Amphibalanus amphitrite TaxID=1232801 RepID=UPI001C907E42|nr:uncharacterized protein LOC122367847 [Amphibalanus amphitrite]XP_043198811.1 uncharacterized protein LOC122368684 [Amphibalanus amphitrite]
MIGYENYTDYASACQLLNLETLSERRDAVLCKLAADILANPAHPLYPGEQLANHSKMADPDLFEFLKLIETEEAALNYCQRTGELRLIRVDRRDAATLLPLIQRHIAPGTTVYSDEWAAYHGIDAIPGGNYIHRTVNHQNNFINPADQAVHTQGIEGAWSRAKLDLMRLKRGTSPELLPGHLARLWWQSRDRDDVRPFLNILQLIREAYPQ